MQDYRQENYNQVVTVGEWFITMIVLAIPIVNIIMLFVWGFGNNNKPSRANFCKLSLIMMLISIVLAIILSVTGVMTFNSFVNMG